MLFYDSSEFLTKFRSKLAFDLDRLAPIGDLLFYRNQILDNFDKKYVKSGPGIDTEMECYLKFLRVNAEMKALNDGYASYQSIWHANPVLLRAKRICAHILGSAPLLEEIFQRSKHSAGASVGVKFTDTSLEAKMDFPISGTKSGCRLWEHYKFWDWDFYSQACNLNEGPVEFTETVTVDGSRATTVPKTNKIDRFIAVEPTLNMFFQQGISACLDMCLSRAGLSLSSDQEKHRRLAYIGSISSQYSTIDFSSMSDRLSLAICHFLLPKDWYSLLFTVRSHRTALRGKALPLHMISSMGNATTFPLETLILYCIARSACSQIQGRSTLDVSGVHDVHVFGDDCIIPSPASDLFINSCVIAGFAVNNDKTFTSGSFRESCGGDFYHGRDVRPFYLKSLSSDIKRKTDKEAYMYSTINGVLRMYRKYFGTLTYLYDKSLLRFLFSCLHTHTNDVKFVPEDYPEDSGITCLRELKRFLHSYRLSLSPIKVNEHGQLTLKALMYKFPNQKPMHEGLRYYSLKKFGIAQIRKSWSEYLIESSDTISSRLRREGGFYVVRNVDKDNRPFAILSSTLFSPGDPLAYLPVSSERERSLTGYSRPLN